ncbi:MAG: GAF domain-containing protein [Anaerolineales bacterium]|nr:GAF domain-containing protein [Anaerolineales bacterium]
MRSFWRSPENRLVLIYLALAAVWLFMTEGLMATRWFGVMGGWATHGAYALGSLGLAVAFIWHNGRRAEYEAASRKQAETQISRIFNTAADAIVVVDSKFNVVQFNPSAEALYGFTAPEVIGQSVSQLLPEARVAEYGQRFLNFARAPETVAFFSNFEDNYGRRKDGTEFPAEGSITKLGQNGGQTYVFILRDISERKRVDNALRSIAEGTAAVTGDDFFHSLVRHLAAALQVRYAFVAECTDASRTRVRTLAFWMGKDFGENFEYALAETPCEAVIGGEICYHPNKVREMFPHDADLVKLEAESYLGIPLRDSGGNIIGHLAALDKSPMPDPARVLAILNIFATRAGAELERNHAVHQLARTAQEREALNQMGQAVVASLELPVVLQQVIENTRQLLGAEDVYVLLREADELVFAAVGGLSAATLQGYRVAATTGVAGQVLTSGQATQGHCGNHNLIELGECHDEVLLAVPLKLGNEIIGVMEAVQPRADMANAEGLRVLELAAIWATLAIDNARRHTHLGRRLQETESLAAITQALNETLNLATIFQMIVEVVGQIIPHVERAVIHVLDEPAQTLRAMAVSGRPEPQHGELVMRPGEGVAGLVMAQGMVINVPDTQRDARYMMSSPQTPFRSLLVAPVQSGVHRLGTLSAQSAAPHAFSPDDERLLATLGNHAALALHNARLYGELSKALQQEKATRAQLVQNEKLAAMGRLVASVAHEINNPLQAIQNALYLINQEPCLAELTREYLQVAITEGNRMAELISRLRETYRPTTSESFEPESLNALVMHIHKLIATHLRHSRVTFEFAPDPELPIILGNRDQLKQALLNLCLNAVDAMPNGGHLHLNTENHPHLSEVWLTVADTGSGISPAALNSVFEPFFTTKANGTGLGLAITHDIVQQHAGRIEVESQVGRGTKFTLRLPAAQPGPVFTRLGTAPLNLE